MRSPLSICLLAFFAVWTVLPAFADKADAHLTQPNRPSEILLRAYSEEKSDRFTEAETILDSQKVLGETEQTHLTHLRALNRMIEVSDNDKNVTPDERAKALGDLLSTFDRDKDMYLLDKGRRELNLLDAERVSFRGSQLGQFFARANSSRHSGDLWSFPVTTAWVLVVPVLLVVLVVYLLWRFWPRSGYLISFEDLDAEPSSKRQRDRILTQEIQEAFSVPRTEQTFGDVDLRVFAINDHDGSSFVTLIPQNVLVGWSKIVQTSFPVKLGPVELNLKDILAVLFGGLQSPTRKALVGSLHQKDGLIVLKAQRLDRRRKAVPGFTWTVQGDSSAEAVQGLISDLAAQILIDLRATDLTRHWRSYRSLILGITALDQRPPSKDSCNCFGIAKGQLQNALQEDPSNWLARFYLAIALRRCGNNEEAARHLEVVVKVFTQAAERLANRRGFHIWPSKSFLEKHIEKYPQCVLIVLHNRAMALSKLHNLPAMMHSLKLFSQIVDLCNRGVEIPAELVGEIDEKPVASLRWLMGKLTKLDRYKFASIALSAKTLVWAAQAEFLCSEEIKLSQDYLSKIVAAEKYIRSSAQSKPLVRSMFHSDGPSSLNLGLATILCAKGKVWLVLGQVEPARRSFEESILISPNLIDAQLSLASLLINHRKDYPAWFDLASDAIDRVLTFDRDCSKAHYWLARIAVSKIPPDYERALNSLDKAEELPESSFLRAEILVRDDFDRRDVQRAVDAWRKGLLAIQPALSPDQVLHVQTLETLAQKSSDCQIKAVAAMALRHIAQNCPWNLRTFADASAETSVRDGEPSGITIVSTSA
jgi:tetratricopeptide (TPR) repeat protein